MTHSPSCLVEDREHRAFALIPSLSFPHDYTSPLVAQTSPASSATLTGVLERIIFLNEENHYTIAEFRPDEKSAPPSPAQSAASAPPPDRGECFSSFFSF